MQAFPFIHYEGWSKFDRDENFIELYARIGRQEFTVVYSLCDDDELSLLMIFHGYIDNEPKPDRRMCFLCAKTHDYGEECKCSEDTVTTMGKWLFEQAAKQNWRIGC